MKRISVLVLLTAALGSAQSDQARIEGLLAKLSVYQYGMDPAPQVQLDEIVGRLSGSPQSRRMIEGLLLKFLQSDATPAGKEAAFRQLSLVGSDASVPVLAPLLIQIGTAEMARYALAAITGPAAGAALGAALPRAPSDRIRIWLINSLGARKDSKAVSALAPLAASTNLEVAAAALAALASIADKPALEALTRAHRSASGPARGMAIEALVVCADHFAARGDKATAASVYKQAIAPAEPPNVRSRALKGLAAADPGAAMAALARELESSDLVRQVDALRILNGVPGSAAARTMITAYPNLPPAAKVHVLTSLAFRGDAAGKGIATAAAGATDQAVRAAGLSALGRLGDASSVRVLAEAAAGEEPGATAARGSLTMLRGDAADAAIVSALGSSTGKIRSELIRAVGERASSSAADALVKAAGDTDPEIRRDALRGLRNVGGAAQTAPLLNLVLNTQSASERREASLALVAVLKRSQPVSIAPVIAAYNSATAKPARLSLIEVMGQTSSAEALPLLRSHLKDPDPEVARAAILALSAWDNAAPIADLMAIARSGQRTAPPSAGPPPPGGGGGRGQPPPTNNLQILAIRGVLRLMVLESKRTPAESGALLAELLSLSTQIAEKRAVLGLLQSFPSPVTLQLAQEAAKDGSVKNEALVAMAQVSEALKAK
jgi:HEAT repeat protein